MKNLLCIAVMVKDDITRIEKTLCSVVDFVDHVIVLDTSNTDNTLDNIRKLCQLKNKPLVTEKVPFVNFSHNHNYLLKMCHGHSEFILLLDANEEARELDTLRRFLSIKRSNRKESGFKCRYGLQNDIGIKGNDKIFYKVGIIRNNIDEIYYQSPVHEYLTTTDPSQFIINEELCDTPFYIYQDRLNDKPDDSYYHQNIEVLEQYLKTHKDDTHTYHYLIESYKNVKDIDMLFKYCEKQIATYEKDKLVNYVYYDEYYHALLNIGYAYAEIGNDNFFKWMLKAYKHCMLLYDNPEAFLAIGQIYQKRNQLNLAYLYFKKACGLEEPRSIPREVTYKPTIYRQDRWSELRDLSYKINKLDDYYLALAKLKH